MISTFSVQMEDQEQRENRPIQKDIVRWRYKPAVDAEEKNMMKLVKRLAEDRDTWRKTTQQPSGTENEMTHNEWSLCCCTVSSTVIY